MRHVTSEWVVSHMDESCHTWRRICLQLCGGWRRNGRVFLHLNESCHIWMSPVIYNMKTMYHHKVMRSIWIAYINTICQHSTRTQYAHTICPPNTIITIHQHHTSTENSQYVTQCVNSIHQHNIFNTVHEHTKHTQYVHPTQSTQYINTTSQQNSHKTPHSIWTPHINTICQHIISNVISRAVSSKGPHNPSSTQYINTTPQQNTHNMSHGVCTPHINTIYTMSYTVYEYSASTQYVKTV